MIGDPTVRGGTCRSASLYSGAFVSWLMDGLENGCRVFANRPAPWASLKYDTGLGGYRVGITEDQLNNAPRFNRSTDWDWSDRARDRTVCDYYKTPLWC
jgi:hypothetical protein